MQHALSRALGALDKRYPPYGWQIDRQYGCRNRAPNGISVLPPQLVDRGTRSTSSAIRCMSAFRSGPLTMKLNPVKPRPRRSHSWLTACLAEPVIAWLRLGIWIDADAHVEDAADLAWPSAGRFGSGVDPAPHGGNLPSGHGAQRGDPAVGEPGGDSKRARPEGPQPYRDRAAGLGFHVEVADAVVAPVLGVAGVCPGAVDDLNGFCEAIEGSGCLS